MTQIPFQGKSLWKRTNQTFMKGKQKYWWKVTPSHSFFYNLLLGNNENKLKRKSDDVEERKNRNKIDYFTESKKYGQTSNNLDFDNTQLMVADNTIMDLLIPKDLFLQGDYCFRIKHRNAMSSELVCRLGINTSFLNDNGNV